MIFSRRSTDSFRIVAVVATIVGATLLGYAHTLRAPFLFDDIHGIVMNRTLSGFWTALHPPVNEPLSSRPFANLTFAANRAISGDAEWSYHVLNLAIHLAAALALFGVLRRIFFARFGSRTEPPSGAADPGATYSAGIAALLWAVHPLQTEAVSFVVQRSESLMSLLYLFTFYGFLRAADSEKPALWYVGSVVACGFGMATKEVMFSAPLVVLLYDRCFCCGSFASALRQRPWYFVSLASTWLVLAICLVQSGSRVAGFGGIPAPTPWEYLVTQAIAIPHYLRLAAWPAGQVFDYGYGTIPFGAVPALAMAALAIAGGGVCWALIRHRSRLGFAGVCFFVLLAPSSSFVPLAQQTIAEHRMYLALAAPLAVVVLWLTVRLGRRSAPIMALAALGFAALTVQRNSLYASRLALWRDTVRKVPANARAWAYLGHRLADAGQWAEAISACETQLRVDPRYNVDADAIIGRSLLELGNPSAALPHLEQAARLTPDAFDAWTNLGMAYAALDRLLDAIRQYERALALNPEAAEAHGNLANALVRSGRADEAWPHYAAAAKTRPTDPQPEINWASSLAEVGDTAAATAHFERALALDPKSTAAHLGLGDIQAKAGHLPEAIAHFEAAIRIGPRTAEAEHNLAVALMQAGKVPEAIAHFRATVKLVPSSAEAHFEFASALAESGDAIEARQECETALRLDPNLEAARELLTALGR